MFYKDSSSMRFFATFATLLETRFCLTQSAEVRKAAQNWNPAPPN